MDFHYQIVVASSGKPREVGSFQLYVQNGKVFSWSSGVRSGETGTLGRELTAYTMITLPTTTYVLYCTQ